jgi:hypothetical protein
LGIEPKAFEPVARRYTKWGTQAPYIRLFHELI